MITNFRGSEPGSTITDLEIAHRLLDSFSQIAEVINARRLGYDKRLSRILTIILGYIGVEQGSIMLLEKGGLKVRAASRPELVGLVQPLTEDSVAGWVAKNGEPLFLPDISRDERFNKRCRGSSYKKNSLMSVPILYRGRVIGVINMTDKRGATDLLKEDVAKLFDFSSLILSALIQENLQAEVRKQRNILTKRNRELKRQEKMRSELSRMLVHDLKGPLAEVVANLDILSYSVSGENREFLEAAQMACNRAERMVSNLVSIDKLEDGKMKLIRQEVDPANILAESYSAFKGLARIKDVELVLEAADDLPPVLVDRVLILRVLQNLLTNALGYTSPDTVITFGCRRIPEKKRLEFYVLDQGPGIPEEKKKVIFEKYARISDKQDALVGTGLGLYFCKLAVEAHRGAIGIEGAAGGGSRFFFTLPC